MASPIRATDAARHSSAYWLDFPERESSMVRLPLSNLILKRTNHVHSRLVEKNKIADARKALAHVRAKDPSDEDVTRELEEIVEDFMGHEKMPLIAQVKVTCSNGKTFYTFAMAVVLMFWQQWTGTNSINYVSATLSQEIVRERGVLTDLIHTVLSSNLQSCRPRRHQRRPLRNWNLWSREGRHYCFGPHVRYGTAR